jgi:hypothetical protein
MKSVFFPVVMLVGIAASTVHPAHAGWRQGPSGTECTSHTEYNGDVTTDCHSTPGDVEQYYTADTPAPASRPQWRTWTDLSGNKHDCRYGEPLLFLYRQGCHWEYMD